jgi:hypothetical protein
MIPLPRDDVTPPVTNIFLVVINSVLGGWMIKIGDIYADFKPKCLFGNILT